MKARLVSVLASTTLAVAALAVAAPAHADPVPEAERVVITGVSVSQNASLKVIAGAVIRVSQNGNRPTLGTTLHVMWSSCGNPVKESSTVIGDRYPDRPAGIATLFSPNGSFDLRPNSVNQMVGRSVEYTLTITQPGYDPFALTGSYSGYTTPRPSCETINSPGYGDEPASITVTQWSARKGATMTAKVGKTLKVTPTRAAGAKVAYMWKVGTKVVDRDRAMTVKRSYRGKKVTMRVTVSKSGAKSVSKTLRYGNAR